MLSGSRVVMRPTLRYLEPDDRLDRCIARRGRIWLGRREQVDFVVWYDLLLPPSVFGSIQFGRIILNAREYYPGQTEAGLGGLRRPAIPEIAH